MEQGFVFIDIESGEGCVCLKTGAQAIASIEAINEIGDRLTVKGEARKLSKENYEELKRFIGERAIFLDDHGASDWLWSRSLIVGSVLAGCPILNCSHPLAVSRRDKRLEAFARKRLNEEEYLKAMKEIILSGSYFDGEDTREVSYNQFIAHGDVAGRGFAAIKHSVFDCSEFFLKKGFFADEELATTIRNTRQIVSLTRFKRKEGEAPALMDRFYLVTTDGENDPSYNGLLPLLGHPELALIYKENGLSYFEDWEYRVEDVFSRDTKPEVIEHYLGILKAKAIEVSSRHS